MSSHAIPAPARRLRAGIVGGGRGKAEAPHRRTRRDRGYTACTGHSVEVKRDVKRS